MKKLIKYTVYTILSLVALLLLAVLTIPLWIGSMARPVINKSVPLITKTHFNIAHLSLNPYTGRFQLGGFVLGNPEGYDEKTAVSLGNLVFDVAMTTLGDEYVHIEEVVVEDVFVSYVKGGQYDVDNFTQIQYNVAGSKEEYEEAKKRSALAETEAGEEVLEESEEAVEEVSERKFVIDRLVIKGIKLKYGPITIPVPVDIELKDLGKKSDGMTLAELVEEIWKAILASAGAIGEGVKALGSVIGESAGKLEKDISQAADSLGMGASKTAEAVGEGAAKTVETVTEGTSKAVDAVGEGVKKTSDAVKKLLSF